MTLIVAFLHKIALSLDLKNAALHSEQNCLLSGATDIDGVWSPESRTAQNTGRGVGEEIQPGSTAGLIWLSTVGS